jgi:hypothetical protein
VDKGFNMTINNLLSEFSSFSAAAAGAKVKTV